MQAVEGCLPILYIILQIASTRLSKQWMLDDMPPLAFYQKAVSNREALLRVYAMSLESLSFPFMLCSGVFIRLDGFEKHALVHHSQISDEVSFGRDDEDADKIAALEYFCPGGAKVINYCTPPGK